MNLNKISFCDTFSFNVNSNIYKKEILESINYGALCDKITNNKYSNRMTNILMRNKHLASIKTIGNQYLLYITTDYMDNKVCLFIDTKISDKHNYPRMTYCKFRFRDEVYKNTLIFGEMIKTNNDEWYFLMNDIYIHRGRTIAKETFFMRLGLIYELLEKSYKYDENMDVCKLRVKPYYILSDINKCFGRIDFNYGGIIFKDIYGANNIEYSFNRKDKNIQVNKSIKPEDNRTKKHTINQGVHIDKLFVKNNANAVRNNNNAVKNNAVKIPVNNVVNIVCNNYKTFVIKSSNQSGIYHLYCDKNREYVYHSVARIKNLQMLDTIKQLLKEGRNKVRCEYHTDFKKWVPLEASEESVVKYDFE